MLNLNTKFDTLLALFSTSIDENLDTFTKVRSLLTSYAAEGFVNVLEAQTLEDFIDHIKDQLDYYVPDSDVTIEFITDGFRSIDDANTEIQRLHDLNKQVMKHAASIYYLSKLDLLVNLKQRK